MEYRQLEVLGKELVSAWQLSDEEADYINRQQGHVCTACQSNLRSRTMAAAVLDHYRFSGILADFCVSRRARHLRILELNEAGSLSPWLGGLPKHTLARYPDVDIHSLPYADGSYEAILHSDVLEHVQKPVLGLQECFRVLASDGVLFYTVPVVHGRLSRTREGLAPSYHGLSDQTMDDWLVRTEYGADFWIQPIAAGFRRIGLFTLGGADTVTIVCTK